MRDLIFQRALELFSEKGYRGASMRELARRCGTTPSNVYNYFPSKEELLREVFRVGGDQIRETLAADETDSGTDRGRYLRRVLRTVTENHLLWRMIHQLRLNEEVSQVLESEFQTVLDDALGDLESYCSEPWLLLVIVDGLVASRLQGLPHPPDDKVVRTVVRCLEALDEPDAT